MLEIRNGVNYLIIVYVAVCLSLWYKKPTIMFDGDNVIPFGLGNGKTLFNYYIVVILIAIVLFYMYEIIMLKKNNFL